MVIPVVTPEQMERANATAPIQVITDGSEPNTANFMLGYVGSAPDLANAASGGQRADF